MPHTERDAEPWTFALDATGDIQWSDANAPRVVRGVERTTAQALKVALATYSEGEFTDGEDPRDPEFGLDVFAATKSMQSLKREIRRTLEYDDYRHDRVTHVRDISINRPTGSKEDVEVAVVVSLADEPEDITLTFDLFSGQIAVSGGTF